jgi:hypothetical protein
MAEEDQEKTAFVMEWGVFVAVVMMFGLKTAPATFQQIIMEIFKEYIPGFMQVFLDDFAIFGTRKAHLPCPSTPLHATVHREPFMWTEEEEKAFATLKLLLTRALVVQPPDWNREFHVFVDASDIAISNVLMQKYEKNWFRPVYYASRRLLKAERNYSTTEREALRMIYSVTKFRHYLLGKRFTFHVDHSTLVYLVSKASLTGKLARWTLLLQEYEFDIVHRPGAQHVVADYLSRLESGEAPAGVADDFPDTEVMTVTPETGPRDDPDRWLTDIIYFLSHDVPPEELSKAERKRMGVRSRAFSLMNDNLYHKSVDGVLTSKRSGRWALCRASNGLEGLAKRIMVANGVAGHTPIRKGVGTDAASARSSAGTLLEMGTRLCRSI